MGVSKSYELPQVHSQLLSISPESCTNRVEYNVNQARAYYRQEQVEIDATVAVLMQGRNIAS